MHAETRKMPPAPKSGGGVDGVVAARAAAARRALPPAAPAVLSVASTSLGHAGGHARGERTGDTEAAALKRVTVSAALARVCSAAASIGSPTTRTREPHVVAVPQSAT